MTDITDEPTERWAPVPGHPLHQVSTYGRVKNPKGKLIGKPNHVRGYVRVSLPGGDVRLVHQVVLEAFVGPRPTGHQSRHLNGIPTDNRLSNLRWGTAAENVADQFIHGHRQRSERMTTEG